MDLCQPERGKSRDAALILLLLLPRYAPAQSLYGSLVGNVSDTSSAAVAGAKVGIVNDNTNESRETHSNAEGGYSFS